MKHEQSYTYTYAQPDGARRLGTVVAPDSGEANTIARLHCELAGDMFLALGVHLVEVEAVRL